MMPAKTSIDLAQTRAAFDAWRANRPGRRRIPEHLWQMAIALLNEHSLSRVAHELRLSTKQLRRRKLTAIQPPFSDSANGLHFLPMRLRENVKAAELQIPAETIAELNSIGARR